MARFVWVIAVSLGLAWPLPAWANPTVVPMPKVSCVTGRCHRGVTDARYIHGPIATGSCEICHQVKSVAEGKHPTLVTEVTAERCYFCHEEARHQKEYKYRHFLVEKGDCVSCHDPHGANNRFLLLGLSEGAEQPSILCRGCHNEKRPFKSLDFHQAVGLLDCTTCHDPHGSAYSFHLTRYVKTVYIRDYLALGEEALREKDYPEALQNFRLVLTVEPREVSALIMAAQATLALNQLDQADVFADRLMAINPLNNEALFLKGRIALARGQDYRALAFMQQSLNIKPDDPQTLHALGRLQMKGGLHSEALGSLTKATQRRPTDVEIRRSLVELYRAMGRGEDASREEGAIKSISSPPATP
jgi:predicted CXXCH cytochrome family protein